MGSRISDSGGPVWFSSWPYNSGPDLHRQQSPRGRFGVHPTVSLWEFCGRCFGSISRLNPTLKLIQTVGYLWSRCQSSVCITGGKSDSFPLKVDYLSPIQFITFLKKGRIFGHRHGVKPDPVLQMMWYCWHRQAAIYNSHWSGSQPSAKRLG